MTEQRETLKIVRQQLLDLHKVLLDRERAIYELRNEPIASPGAFLQIVLSHPQFEWLRKLSGLVVQFDEALSIRKPAAPEEGAALLGEAKDLLTTDAVPEFSSRYQDALADSPNARKLHWQVVYGREEAGVRDPDLPQPPVPGRAE